MAKKTNLHPVVVSILAASFLAMAWRVPAFSIFIFFGLAPLFALCDHVRQDSVWEKTEYVLVALVVYFFAGTGATSDNIVPTLVLSIVFAFPFLVYSWVKGALGIRTAKITIVIFWLALEYLQVKIRPGEGIFLADALQSRPEWTRWNEHTGYLGSSLWILAVNAFMYRAFLSEEPVTWRWTSIAALSLAGPLVYSYSLAEPSLSRDAMVKLYSDKSLVHNVAYLARGEFIVRTAAWLSTLILLFTLVKIGIKKR